jgi:hypothetical protein
MMRAFILAELPNEPRPPRERYQKFARMYSPGSLPSRAKGVVLFYLGRKEQAQEEFRKARPEFALSRSWQTFYDAVRQFDCSEISEEALLATAGASRISLVLCNAATLVRIRDVLRLSFLFIRIPGLVTPWHSSLLTQHTAKLELREDLKINSKHLPCRD